MAGSPLSGYGEVREGKQKLNKDCHKKRSQDLLVLKISRLSRWQTMLMLGNYF